MNLYFFLSFMISFVLAYFNLNEIFMFNSISQIALLHIMPRILNVQN